MRVKSSEVEWDVGGTANSEPALRSAGTVLSRIQALSPAPWLNGELESLRSPCCKQAIHNNQILKLKYASESVQKLHFGYVMVRFLALRS
ncbi:hypothetical protein PoB_001663500 [Plakobranchus ocellatus]|uniref:Uncharacterized protein n=1 Tax=Plakobranchus ocellatus TaxID=259542 RepID=A0AAV3Z6F2_9GAST|nr:hypothetical protein PoB_001663500 [Plakobranchus ocellatus]